MSWVLSLVINWLLTGYLWPDIATGAHAGLDTVHYRCTNGVQVSQPGMSRTMVICKPEECQRERLWDACEASQGAFTALK